MEKQNTNDNEPNGFKKYLLTRIVLISAASLIGLWGFVMILNWINPASVVLAEKALHEKGASSTGSTAVKTHEPPTTSPESVSKPIPDESVAEPISQPIETHTAAAAKKKESAKVPSAPVHPTAAGPSSAPVLERPGVAFITAAIKPLSFELNERWWGWRPNDILNFTDNVNNFQLGVLEATRRTSMILAERISRTGATASFDPNLERAMNWFMIGADRYWFPSAESKYKEGLHEFNAYKNRLLNGKAPFYTRTDNLIPLLNAYVDLLGSCEENLVKEHEEDSEPVGYFSADDYFFYAKGVAHTLLILLEAVEIDFAETIESRRGSEVLNHAVEACRRAVDIDPALITNSALSGILANHRANMAAPISHARFYLEVLVKTLST